MKIDITSMFFNSSVNGTATAAWRTSIGQNKTKQCRIESDVPGVTDIVVGMMHLLKDDFSTKSHMTRGGNNDELLISSVFEKVYINGNRLKDCKYVLSIVREHTVSHEGRKELCYSPNLCYGDDIANSEAIKKMATALGCTEDGCWFVYDISVKNQDELHFSAIVVDPESPADYDCGGAERSNIWNMMVAEQTGEEMLTKQVDLDLPLQQITYGAPGTGKSHGIKKETAGKSVIRTTFHPDSDYSTFVGAYKPVMEETDVRVVPVVLNNGASFDQNNGTLKEKRISYKFVKQAFLKAYLGAWKKYAEAEEIPEPQFLVIEEINRGNCAQIFGDLFQLLDRNDENGFSTYPIDADTDLQKEIEKAFKEEKDGESDNPYMLSNDIYVEGVVEDYSSNYDASLSEDIQEGRVLLLPPNLFIWATMNTSDQSLFPIDSAFKRRWAWDYVKITDGKKGWKIQGTDYSCDWWKFIQEINKKIATATSSDDKKLGYYFCKAKNNTTCIDEKLFVSKVIFYLWNDVFKDNDNTIFKVKESKDEPSFDDFFMEDNGEIVPNPSAVKQFLINVVGAENVLDVQQQNGDINPITQPSE